MGYPMSVLSVIIKISVYFFDSSFEPTHTTENGH